HSGRRRFVPYSPPRAPGRLAYVEAVADFDGVAIWPPIWRCLLQTRFALVRYRSRHRHQRGISPARALASFATYASKRSRGKGLSTKLTLTVVRSAFTSDASTCGAKPAPEIRAPRVAPCPQ